MNRPKTKPGIGSTEDPHLDSVVSEQPGVVVTAGPHAARFDTDPRLALRPAAEQALVRGLVPLKGEPERAELPPIDAMASAARAEAKLLGLKRKGPSAEESGEQETSSEATVELDAPTVPLAPRRRKIGSTTAGLRAASRDLTKFAFLAVGLALGAYALIWWLANRTPSTPNVATPSPSSTQAAPTPASATAVVASSAATLAPSPTVTPSAPPSASAKLPTKVHSPPTTPVVAPQAPTAPSIAPAPKPSATGEDDPLRIKGI